MSISMSAQTIEKLWKSYEDAMSADKPKTAMEVLDKIKESAKEQRRPWDFYLAASRYVDCGSSINWKDHTALVQKKDEEIKAYDEPILTYFHERSAMNSARAKAFVDEHKEVLKAGHHKEFYENDSYITSYKFGTVLRDILENDYEYALWSIGFRYSPAVEKDLRQMYGHKYPQEAFMDFAFSKSTAKMNDMKEFAAKYQGKAMSLLAREILLRDKFTEISKTELKVDTPFKDLKKECASFISEKKKYTGIEKKIADCSVEVERIINDLDGKYLSAEVKNNEMTVTFKNLEKADYVILRDKTKVAEGTVKNQKNRYFLEDKATTLLKDIDDGDYVIELKSGKEQYKIDYRKYTISLAVKKESQSRIAIYAADYWTGKPLDVCDVKIINDDKTVAEKKGIKLHGFTYLPEEITKHASWDAEIVCTFKDASGRLHSSRSSRFNSPYKSAIGSVDKWEGILIQDRTAFHPGESVHFKGIIYHGDDRIELKTAEEGTEVKVVLLDPDRNKVEEKTLRTNAFGAVAGEFNLTAGKKKGNYEIRLSMGDKYLESSYIQVDDYVLPTFTLTFDPIDKFYFCGDEVMFSGVLKSYSGHSLSGADVKYVATVDGTVVSSGKLLLSPTGKFSVTIPKDEKASDRWYSYAELEIRVVDATGETHDWQKTVSMQNSIGLRTTIVNSNEGNVTAVEQEGAISGTNILNEDNLKLQFNVQKHDGLDITYTVYSGKVIIAKGKAEAGSVKSVDLSSQPSGLYHVKVEASAKTVSGKEIEAHNEFQIIKISKSDTTFKVQSESIISLLKGDDIAFQFGAGLDDLWACIELIGEGDVTLHSELVQIKKGEMKAFHYAFEPNYPNNVTLKVLYFREGSCEQWSKNFVNTAKSLYLPLQFTRFVDKAQPRQACHFEMTTLPNVECAVSVYDKSTEAIRTNDWATIALRSAAPTLSYDISLGTNRSSFHFEAVMARTSMRGAMKASGGVVYESVEEEAMPMVEINDSAPATDAVEENNVMEAEIREDFAGTIAFEPFLYSDAEGKVAFDVTTGDLLSTFYVYVYGHDKSMRNATMRQEMLVTIPVKLSVVEPQLLYVGDRYVVKANLSSNLQVPCTGTISMSLFDGSDYKGTKPFAMKQQVVTIPAGGTTPVEFEVNVPAVSELGMLLKFNATNAADAVFVAIPVKPAKQTLTEAHSAVLHPGDSEAELEAKLRAMFVNVQGSEADMKITSLLDLVREALPELIEPSGKDAVSLTQAMYARVLTAKLNGTVADNKELLEKLLKCQNPDGGFAWFEEMTSSGIITAQILNMAGTARERGLDLLPGEVTAKAVKFLDATYFSKDNKYRWYCTVTMRQYAFVRALFPEVAFEVKNIDRKEYRQFKKETTEYLVPKKDRGMNGYILSKARRLRTLMLLNSSESGIELAKAFGIRFCTSRRISKSINADIESLLEYAVEHKSGGMYYPNAVMPFRGLLESELEAHSLLCDLLRDCTAKGLLSDEKVSDGIRLWLMIQKETQQWKKDPAYIEAIASVLDGSEYILATKVMSLSKTYTVPFELIQESGNGMSIKRRFILMDKEGESHEIAEGEVLHIGDKVEARYEIWNEENRSFVHVNASRPASFRPTQQLSGHYGWWLAPFVVDNFYTFTPQGYREVEIGGSEYWFDAYPEEKTTITEEFFVTQEGSFQMPVIEIECLYAPHYRANDACHHCPIVSE